MKVKNQTISPQTPVFTDDLVDAVCFCHAGLAQDALYSSDHYLNVIMNILFGYLGPTQRQEVEKYLAGKEYIPPVKLVLPNDERV